MRGQVVAGAADAKCPRFEIVARASTDRAGLAGQDRFVKFGLVPDNRAVGDHLVAAAQDEQIIGDDIGRQDLGLKALAHDCRCRRRQCDELSQFAGGSQLLERSDEHVGEHDHADKGRVLQVVGLLLRDGQDQQDADQAEQDHVEVGEDVREDDVEVGALLRGVTIDAAVAHALVDLGLRETDEFGRLSRSGPGRRSRRLDRLGQRRACERRLQRQWWRRLGGRGGRPIREPAALTSTFNLSERLAHAVQRVGIERRLALFQRGEVKYGLRNIVDGVGGAVTGLAGHETILWTEQYCRLVLTLASRSVSE